MDHQYVEKQDIADRYLRGRLSAQERDEFEEHYFECEACIERLELTERFRRGLRQIGAEELARLRATGPGGIVGWWARLGPRWPVAIGLAALVLLVALPVTFLLVQMSRARHELEQAQAASAHWQRQYEIEQQATKALEEKFREAEAALAQRRAQSPQAPRTPTAEDRDQSPLRQPRINTPIFDLIAVRSSESGPSGSSNEVILTPSTDWFIFTLGLESERQYETYRATILTPQHRLVWRTSGLRPTQHRELTIGFPGDFFSAGEYLLRLEGLTHSGQPVAVANYPFRVVKAQGQ